ncbi:MAG: VCBS repeat-containing protein, partial [Saprospiraceae bacterium]|nr:VCBS repeat-containing protein [Saprospiraceae bacterium]
MKQWKSSLRIGVVFLVGLLLPTLELWAQDWERLSPSCDVGTRSLDFPFAGGLQAPQFSQGDFNGDGTDDIFVFDRSGNVGMIFLQDSGSYQFSSTHSARLPALRDWALARDFNGDGIVDLFSRAPGVQGMTVHQGSLVNGVMQYDPWHFASDVQALIYPSSSGHPINLYAAATDIPAITDLDQDGDLDVLSFDQTGTFAVYYRNQSVESGFGSDSLIYTLEDPCWGKFAENSLTNDVTLSSNNRDCAAFASNGRSGSGLHSGSTISTLDIDDDGDQEIFLGDIAFKNLVYLKNGGSNDTAFITSFSTEYPNDDPVSVEFFPASFFLDLNGDGLKELVASPNQLRSRERSGIVFLYQAEEDMGQIRHVPDRNGFIHPDMLDFGTESAPLPIDIDGDGLLDLLVGSRNHLGAPADVSGTLFYFRNTGSMESPAYTLVDSNFLNLAEIDLLGADALAPVAVNLDGDDDMDLLIGNKL